MPFAVFSVDLGVEFKVDCVCGLLGSRGTLEAERLVLEFELQVVVR